ncbi:hypothetical protein GCM10010174_79120 [Kutzneria viridogrisea]|uniref:LamG-like jellyroll fold domain-containing protein n=1 Tax=Kutzneria viridogrisea TaxID=47990 RepID=A0ABR6BIS8_9PSEU|nr:hypothetical protein [Kutzneria viridogrisea]
MDKLPTKLGNLLPGSVVNTSMTGAAPLGQWTLADATGTTPHGAVAFSGDHGGSVALDGHTGMLTTGSTVDTTASYTVSAWVNLKSTDGFYTAAAQAGTNAGSFYLQYNKTWNCWAFLGFSNDASQPTSYPAARASTPPALNTWTHLVGVYDSATHAMRLYVNGTLAGTGTNPSAWKATGPVTIGAIAYGNGTTTDYFNGSISDVRVYQQALTDTDVALLTGSALITGPQPGLKAPATTSATTTLNKTIGSEPNLRTVIVSLGTNDILTGTNADTIGQNLTTMIKANGPNGIKRTYRADGSGPVHVILATVPPLGLDANDKREQQRQLLNTNIRTFFKDYGADSVIDFDNAVRDSANANKIDAKYLNGNTPNDGYYDTLAQTLSDAVTHFPPQAQL